MTSGDVHRPTTAWVIDHPSHVHVLDRFIRSSNEKDIVFAVERKEVQSLIDGSRFHGKPVHWLPRPSGSISMLRRAFRAMVRQRRIRRILVQHQGVERIVAINAPLEIKVARQVGIGERILVLDVEIDHLVQRLAARSATMIVVPTDWMDDLAHPCMSSLEIKRLRGPWAHLYVRNQTELPSTDTILIRRLRGDGNHDRDEMVSITQLMERSPSFIVWDEDIPLDEPWQGPGLSQDVRAVISQSVTVAIEAALVGRPVLLASRAKRGVIDGLIERGAPILRWTGSDDNSILKRWEILLNDPPKWRDPQGGDVLGDWTEILRFSPTQI